MIRLFNDSQLGNFGLQVIEGEKKGPAVPNDFDPKTLKPVGFDRFVGNGEETRRQAVEELNSPFGREYLWWLLNHQDQIPEEWKQWRHIAFAGDVVQSPDGERYVLYLYWDGVQWRWRNLWLRYYHWDESVKVLSANAQE